MTHYSILAWEFWSWRCDSFKYFSGQKLLCASSIHLPVKIWTCAGCNHWALPHCEVSVCLSSLQFSPYCPPLPPNPSFSSFTRFSTRHWMWDTIRRGALHLQPIHPLYLSKCKTHQEDVYLLCNTACHSLSQFASHFPTSETLLRNHTNVFNIITYFVWFQMFPGFNCL